MKTKIKKHSTTNEVKIDDYAEKLNFIQGFSFPFSTQFTKETLDGKFIISSGSYPSQVKCFSLDDLNMKFQRNFDSEITDFQILSKNWEKIVFLRSDRKLDFHTKSGLYYQVKIPEKGCDLTFDRNKLMLYIPSIYNHVSVLDFNGGKLLNPIKTDEDSSITCSGKSNNHGLIALGMENGKTEFWDTRVFKSCIGKINSSIYTKFKFKSAIGALRFSDKNENIFFSGSNSGEVMVYDLRCFSPLLSKVIEPLNPIKSIRANNDSNFVLVSNSKCVKYWRFSTGKTKFSLKSRININHICTIRNSGAVLFSLDFNNIGIKYFKKLGPVPEWGETVLN